MESSAPTPRQTGTPRAAAPISERDRNIALVCSVLLLIGMPIGWLPGSTGDTIGMIVFALVMLGVMAAVVLWLAPRERAAARASRTSLILGILAVLAVLVFWTGLPFPLGAGAIMLGLTAREATAQGRGQPTAAIVLGGLAVLLAFVGLLVG